MKTIDEFKKIAVVGYDTADNKFFGRGRKLFAVTLNSLIYVYETDLGELQIYTNKFFVHDGASVPRVAWSISGITPFGPSEIGAIPHDLLFRTKGGRKIIKDFHGDKLEFTISINDKSVYLSYRASNQVMKAGFRLHHSDYHSNRAFRVVERFGHKYWGGPCPAIKK